ncbi:MAG TPA: hypothetical protein VN442_08840 [Bryobacteraceae bacterium]|nr:hypothetical protein [Bryobacteraceae bacterium]
MNVAETLREAMTQNSVQPPGARSYSAGNVSMGYYDAGHMMYVHQPSLEKLKQDLGGFITKVAH